MINPPLTNPLTLMPLTTLENQKCSDVSQGYKMGALARNALN